MSNRINILIKMWTSCCLLILVASTNGIGETVSDTIPPVFITIPEDQNLLCNNTMSSGSAFLAWFSGNANATAEDNGISVPLMSTLSLNEALAVFANSDTLCEVAGIVSVGFFAIDDCNNVSDTLYADFSVEDNEAPQLITNPSNLIVSCNSVSDEMLQAWVLSLAGAELEDNCIDDLAISYSWEDNNGNAGSAQINNPVNIPITRQMCEWYVDVTYNISDGCSNVATFTSRFEIEDNSPPGFVPELDDITIGCNLEIPPVGDISAVDACDGIVPFTVEESSNQDTSINNCLYYNYTVTRTFTATDTCGNQTVETQNIEVRDTVKPFIFLQDTITLDCNTFNENNFDSFFDSYGDDCSDNVLITFGQTELEVNLCSFQVRRNWLIRDRCNNQNTYTQIINVTKEQPPSILEPATDLFIPCDTTISYNVILKDWLDDFGGAIVSGACSNLTTFAASPGSYNVNLPNTFPGDTISNFDLEMCNGFGQNFAHSLAVEFVFYDECDNITVIQASAHIVDDEPPVILEACQDTLLFQIEDTCSTTIKLAHPKITDNCGELESPKVISITKDITSSNPGDVSVVVDPMLFSFNPVDLSNITPGGAVLITVELINIDADDPSEVFSVQDENGFEIGVTPNTFNQCGDTTLVVSSISSGILSFWGLDQVINISVVPQGTGVIAVNDVCAESKVRVSISYEIDINTIVELTYKIDQGPELIGTIGDSLELSLDAGVYEIEYKFTDCGQNETMCTKFVNIRDNSPPVITCPDDLTLPLQNAASCQSAYFFTSDIILTDDCGLSQGDSLKYFIEGATTVGLTTIMSDQAFVFLNAGNNEVTLLAFDASGNSDSCSFNIMVEDNIPPIAMCRDITYLVHPGTPDDINIELDSLNNGSNDLCSAVTFSLSDSIITCEMIDASIDLDLIVTDALGNSDTCTSTVVFGSYILDPLANLGFCDGDTLYLLPNLEDELLGFNYMYNWTGPAGFISTAPSPTILNASVMNNGLYTLEITGAGGCSASGSVMFDFTDRPEIEISSDQGTYCENNPVEISVEEVSGAGSYIWFEGQPPNGTMLLTSTNPMISLFPSLGMHDYYVQVNFNSCLSAPSEAITINVEAPPVAMIANTDTTICTGTNFLFELENEIVGARYEWYGPNGFIIESTEYNLEDVELADAGIYKLVVKLGPCVSDTAFVDIDVVEGYITPIITGENVYCEGSTITLNVNNEPDGEIYTWLLNGSLFSSTASNVLTLNNSSSIFSGDWQVFTRNFNCKSDTSDVFEISVEEMIQIGASNNGPGCQGENITLTGTFLPGANYMWTAPDNETYSGQEVSVPAIEGQYTLLVTTAAGCENTTTTNVVVNSAPTITALSNTSLNCMNIGDTISFLSTIFPQGDYIYEWTGPGFSSDEMIATIDSFTIDNVGSYTLVVYNENCVSNQLVTNVNSNLQPPSTSIEHISGICEGDFLVLESTLEMSGASYIWTTPSGEITTDNPTLSLPSVGIQVDGFYILTISQNGCLSEPSDTLLVSLDEMPDDPIIEAPEFLCAGEILEVNVGEDAEQYIWSGLIDTTTTDPFIILENIETSGSLSVTLMNGSCPSENGDLVMIEVISIPEQPIISIDDFDSCVGPGEDLELCISNYETINTYFIIDDEGVGVNIFDDPCVTLTSDQISNGENSFILFAEVNGCRSIESDTIQFSAYQEDFVGAVIDQESLIVCDNNELLLTTALNVNNANLVWSTTTDDVTIIPQSNNAVLVSNIQDGDNDIFLTTSFGSCTDLSVDMITITSLGAINANDDIVSLDANESRIIDVILNDEFSEAVSLTIIGQPSSGQAFVDEGQITYIPESGFFGDVSIIYEICEVDCPNFCSRAVLEIEVGDDGICTVSSVITPNGDDINDTLIIPCLSNGDYPNNELIIFNQWGDEVYSANPYRNDWKGTYSGKPLPVGTYYYILDLRDGTRPLNGFIILER